MSYTVDKLYAVSSRRVDIYNPEDYTPEEFQKFATLFICLYVSVKDEENNFVNLAYNRLAVDNSQICRSSTWAEFAETLTDAIILGYTTEIPGYTAGEDFPNRYVATWDVMNTFNTFNVDYGDYRSAIESLYAFRHKLLDLVISLKEGAEAPDFNYCIPIVNGYACRPVYREDKGKLYALNGARLCWQEGVNRTPEVSLLDFTKVGEMAVCNLYKSMKEPKANECSLIFCNRTESLDFACDWKIITPEKYPLTDWTPIVVVGGMLILPDEYTINNFTSISFNLMKLPIHKALGLKAYMEDRPNSSAEIAYESEALKPYLEVSLTKPEDDSLCSDCFVVFVKTSRLMVHRKILDTWSHGLTINNYGKEGILLHESTHTIRAYHQATWVDRKELTVQNLEDVSIVDRLVKESQVTYVDSDCRHLNFENLQQDSNYQIIHLFAGD